LKISKTHDNFTNVVFFVKLDRKCAYLILCVYDDFGFAPSNHLYEGPTVLQLDNSTTSAGLQL